MADIDYRVPKVDISDLSDDEKRWAILTSAWVPFLVDNEFKIAFSQAAWDGFFNGLKSEYKDIINRLNLLGPNGDYEIDNTVPKRIEKKPRLGPPPQPPNTRPNNIPR